MNTFKLSVVRQGAPIIHPESIFIAKQGDGFIAAEIDMQSKWCEIVSTFTSSDGSFGFNIYAPERSLHLNEEFHKDLDTQVKIDGLNCNDWEIFTIDCTRYTIRLVMIQREPT